MNAIHVYLRKWKAKRTPLVKRRSAIPLRFEVLEGRSLMSYGPYSAIAEVGNNVANPNWGTAGSDLIRLAKAAYADGISAPSLASDPSARAISNDLNSQASATDASTDIQTVDAQSLSDFGYAFGQFMDHDMSNTPDGGASLPIAVSSSDPIGPAALPFTRSITDPTTGTSTSNPAQQVTDVTSYLDLSQIYGSDAATAADLRTFSGGLLKTSPGNLPPYDNSTYFTAAQLASLNAALGGEQNEGGLPTSQLFATGDIRGNENLELTALQTLFLRNHNRLAGELAAEHPTWTDGQLYQEARKINIADYQSIIYNEWIPAVLGPNALPAYSGYKANVNPTISNEFSTVAFRFGHSLLSGGIERQTNQGLPIADASSDGSSIELADDFFDPNLLSGTTTVDPITGHTTSNIDAILKGDADGNSQADDPLAISDVRDLLFGNYGDGGQDLIALDIQRGRDHGIPDYNTLRVDLGLPRVTSFAQITSNVTYQQELQAAYGNVNDIDAFEGGLFEDHVPGSDVGPLFERIMADQFTRLRDGDRFFYLNESFNADETALFNQTNTLTKTIEANTGITNLQADAFVFRASIGGTVHGMGPGPGGVPNITVELENSAGDVVATTKTDPQGHYLFTQQSGPAASTSDAPGLSATGDYTVVLVLPTGVHQTSASPAAILISKGDTNVAGVDFSLDVPNAPPPPPTGPAAPRLIQNAGGSLSAVPVPMISPSSTSTSNVGTSSNSSATVAAGQSSSTVGTDSVSPAPMPEIPHRRNRSGPNHESAIAFHGIDLNAVSLG